MNQKLELYNRVMEFARQKRPNGILSNLYVAQTIDKDGNVTSETYGMNAFTDYGFSRYFKDNIAFPHYLYLGQSGYTENSLLLNNTIDKNSHTLFEKIGDIHDLDSLRNTTIDYNYPMYYYKIPGSTDGYVTCVCQFQKSVFDYNLTGITNDLTITEYGLGEQNNSAEKLWTHSWIYDITGARTNIVKHVGERLEVTIYFCMVYQTSMITNGWEQQRYTIITTLERFLKYRMKEQACGTYRRFDTGASTEVTTSGRTKQNATSIIENRTQTLYTNLNEFDVEQQVGLQHGYLDGFFHYTPGFVTVEPQVLSMAQAEAFDCVLQNTIANTTPTTPTSMSELLGKNDYGIHALPITQMDLQHLYLYDRDTASYTNPTSYQNDVNHWYTETTLGTWLHCPIYYTNNHMIVQMFVHTNVHTEDPIVAFDNASDVSTIYATDSYWDRNTWEIISNFYQIPEALQTKRYYITNTDSGCLNPIRTSGVFTLTPKNAEYLQYSYQSTGSAGQLATCENYDRGYFVRGDTVFVPSENISFVIGTNTESLISTNGTQQIAHYCYGNIIISVTTHTNSSGYYITNMDSLTQPYTIMQSIVDKDNGFTSITVNCMDQTYRTESHTGLLCFQHTSMNEAVVIDLTHRLPNAENDFYRKRFLSKMACCLYSTNNKKRIAYLSTDDTPMIHIYDFDTNTDVKQFTLPDGVTDVKMMWGLNDHLWITDGASYCRTYNISTTANGSDGIACTNNMTLITNKSDLRYVEITAVRDVILMYQLNDYHIENAWYTRTDQPQTIFNLYDFQTNTQYHNDRSYYRLQYIENNKTLALVIGSGYAYGSNHGSFRMMVDFGQYINPPATASGPVVSVVSNQTMNDVSGWIVYGEHVIFGTYQIPISFFLPHRLVGTTRTHSAINTIKHVSGKQWSITYSNVSPSEFTNNNGYPLGNQN